MYREFALLMGLRLRAYVNGVRFASPPRRLIGGLLAAGGVALFGLILVAFGALLTVTGAQSVALRDELIGRTVFYLFLFLVAGGIPFVSGVLLSPGDLPLLAGVPIRPASLVAARLVDAVVISSAQFVVIGVPLLVASAWAVRPGVLGWVLFVPLLALFLVLPALLVAALLLGLARALGLRRVRFAVAVASAVLSVVMCLLTVSEFSQRASHGGRLSLSGAAQEAASLPPPPEWLPSTWMADALIGVGAPAAAPALLPFALLFVATLAALALCGVLGGPVLVGESLLEGDGDGIARRRSPLDALLAALPLSLPTQALIAKDLRYVARDLVLLSQIGVPVILFLVPFVIAGQVSSGTEQGDLLWFAVGIVATIAYMETSILSLSSVGLEGRGFWLVLGAPVSAGALVSAKWLMAFGTSVAITAPLYVLSCLYFHAAPVYLGVGLVLLLAACAALCGLGVGLSGLFPRFVYENPAHRASLSALVWGFVGATAYVLLGAGFLGGAAWATLSWPEMRPWFLGGGIGLFALLSLGVGLLPLLAARARLSRYAWEE